MNYLTAYIWEQGKRPVNEDSLALLSVTIGRTPVIMAVACDGIGGLDNGEHASSYVTYSLKKAFEDATYSSDCINLRHLRNLMCRTLNRCHTDIKNNHGEASNSGTTCSLVVLIGRRGFLINVGDSRIYKVGSRLLTKDDTNSGMLIRCIGSGTYHRPQMKKIVLKNNDALLIATDGFYKRLHKRILTTSLPEHNEHRMKEWLSDLYIDAVNKGESDNSTAIIITTTNGGKAHE